MIVGDSTICETMSQFVTFMVHIDHSANQNPTLGYPSSISNPRVYPWYIVDSVSNIANIGPLVMKSKTK